ncbi:expressed unknown protein [Seminavis robusta]|uniref:Uncharacterized protein n=1 Tax=Seminavis robusta TaxID=568900 RepID=A0A9N8E518_9STRA|nr:expressed unknown protein [Seminavis robusta]|eukprot:Sro526_g160400.1 n/a (503) ;mRNA; r:33155-34663
MTIFDVPKRSWFGNVSNLESGTSERLGSHFLAKAQGPTTRTSKRKILAMMNNDMTTMMNASAARHTKRPCLSPVPGFPSMGNQAASSPAAPKSPIINSPVWGFQKENLHSFRNDTFSFNDPKHHLWPASAPPGPVKEQSHQQPTLAPCILFAEEPSNSQSLPYASFSSTTAPSAQERLEISNNYFAAKQKWNDTQMDERKRSARLAAFEPALQKLEQKLNDGFKPVEATQYQILITAQQQEKLEYPKSYAASIQAARNYENAKKLYDELGNVDNFTSGTAFGQSPQAGNESRSSLFSSDSFLPPKTQSEKQNTAAPKRSLKNKRKQPTPRAHRRGGIGTPGGKPTKSILRSSSYSAGFVSPKKQTSRARVVFSPASEFKTKFFIPPLELEGIKSPEERQKAAGNRSHKGGSITVAKLVEWYVSNSGRKNDRCEAYLSCASLDEIAKVFCYGCLHGESLAASLTLLRDGGFLNNPACKATGISLAGSEYDRQAQLKQLLGVPA